MSSGIVSNPIGCKITYEGLREEIAALHEELKRDELGYSQIQNVLWYYQEGILKYSDAPMCPNCNSADVLFSESPMKLCGRLSSFVCRTIFCRGCGSFQSGMKRIKEMPELPIESWILTDSSLDSFENHAKEVLTRKPGLRLIDAQESVLLLEQIRVLKRELIAATSQSYVDDIRIPRRK